MEQRTTREMMDGLEHNLRQSLKREEQLRTELAATQLQLKEARDVVRQYSIQLENNQCVDYHVCCGVAVDLSHDKNCAAMKILSRPADTTALNRYVAAELRRIADYWNGALHSAHLRKQADELESTK